MSEARYISDFPDLLTEWHPTKNGELSPYALTRGSDKKVWWLGKCGHEWEDTVSHRVGGRGCPICKNRRIVAGINSLADLYPSVAREWNYDKNIESPNEVGGGTSKKVWWKCSKGHEWFAAINSRTKGNHGCPYCSGRSCITGENDLASKDPEIAREWNYKKNYPLMPSEISYQSSKKVWWKCSEGHEWQATVNNRIGVSRTGCPICRNRKVTAGINDLATTNPEVISEWNYERNESVRPTEIVAGSDKSVWWKCEVCGHEWKTSIRRKVAGAMCPKCDLRAHTSFPEQAILYYIQKTQPNAISRFGELFSGKMEVDVYIPEKKIGIEYDGRQWHKQKDQLDRERRKYQKCKENGVVLIRIREEGGEENDNFCDVLISISDHPGTKDFQKVMTELSKYFSVTKDIDIDRDRAEIESRYKQSLRESSLPFQYPELIKEWDYEKNGKIRPEFYSPGNSRKVWWKCAKGHSWQAPIANRALKKTNCPYCAGQKVIKGENDLATTNPELAKEWNYEKNGELLPDQVAAFSHHKVWWKCSKGHEWQALLINRSHGNGCPICANFYALEGYNDLATLRPDIARRWDYNKNSLKPNQVTVYSGKKVWWLCDKGHSYESKVSNVSRGSGCPYCSNQKVLLGFNDLKTTHPEILSGWDYEKNDILTPETVVAGSNKKVWWKCPHCSNEYYRSVAEAVRIHKCPKCKQETSAPVAPVTVSGNALGGAVCCLTGDFNYGSKKDVENYIVSLGGSCSSSVTAKTNKLIIGAKGSDNYSFGNYGKKYVAAKKRQDAGEDMEIFTEEEFFAKYKA